MSKVCPTSDRDSFHPSASSAEFVDLRHGRVALTPVLLLINLTAFGAMLAHGAGLWHSPNNIQLAWGAGFGPATKDGEWWRLGSALFLHFGVVHLTMNMVALWEAGRLVERLYGQFRFALVYFVGGITGNLASLIVHGDRAISGGASGAIFGIYGALMVCLWRERRQIHPIEFRWLFGGAAMFSAAAAALGLVVPGIDNAAHIGGLISGALAGMALARPLSNNSPKVGHSRWVAMGSLPALVAILLLLVPAPSYRWREELQAREEIRQFQHDDRRILERWQQILDEGRKGTATFEQLAGTIEDEVAREYRDSFEHLSALQLDPAAPSTTTLDILKTYAQLRGNAAHSLAEALRSNDPDRIREALERARRVPDVARSAPSTKLPAPAH